VDRESEESHVQVSDDPRVGTELAGYRIDSLLGRGGMGVVYRAHDLALDRDVALKLLAPDLAEDERFRERFLTESRLAASLDHPAIVPIYDAGEIDGQLYIAMRLVEGTDLKRLLAEEATLEPERALGLLAQVADALDAAHERGLVHRDVKPSNVLIDERGHCYLADFGLARRLVEQATDSGSGPRLSLGTVDYVAPEQIRGDQLDGRADIYSLGCLLYECLAGRTPFAGSATAIVFAHLQKEPPTLPGLEPVIRTALAKNPDERYGSGRKLIEAARDALGIAGPGRSRWPLAAAAVGVALVGAALLAFFLTRGDAGVQAEPGADSLVRIDPETNEVVSTTPVGRRATGVAAAGRYVWVTSFADGTVWRIDPKIDAVRRLPVGGSPTGVAAAPGSVLVANGPQHSLASVDPADTAVSYVTQLPGEGVGGVSVAAGKKDIWFADATQRIAGQVGKGITGGEPRVTIDIPADENSLLSAYETFNGAALGEGAIWVAGDAFGRTVWRLDPRSARVTVAIELPFVPGSIAAGEGAVWVTSLLDDIVARIDPATNRIATTIHVGRGVGGIAAGDGAVWVASSTAPEISRIDPRTNRVVATVPTAELPTRIAVGTGGVWVTTTESAPPVPRGAIGIGVLAACTGPAGSWYDESIAGAELVLLQHGGRRAGSSVRDGVEGARIAGKPVTLALGCSDSTASSTLAEARRLVEQVGVRILIGPTNAEQELALLEYAKRRPEVAFVNGLAGAQVLDPPRNFFSFLPDAAQWMAGLGAHAYRTLGWRRAVIVADSTFTAFHWAQAAGFTAEFCSLGGTILKRIWVPPETQDYSAVIAQIPLQGVDGILAATSSQTAAALIDEYPGLRGNVSRRLITGELAPVSLPERLGRRVSGIRSGGNGGVPPGAAGQKYQAELIGRFPRMSGTLGFVWDYSYHDAMAATAGALAAVGGDLSGGGRRLMAALARVRLASPTGSVRLGVSRTAVGPTYLVRDDPLRGPVITRQVDAVEHTFGGYFKPTDPPPSKDTPACVKRTPPPWAR
jgi:ABC-type branched-subunit amino acid transport system substrate-binding protein/DNA-binding beta-propeller fold protein YncE